MFVSIFKVLVVPLHLALILNIHIVMADDSYISLSVYYLYIYFEENREPEIVKRSKVMSKVKGRGIVRRQFMYE